MKEKTVSRCLLVLLPLCSVLSKLKNCWLRSLPKSLCLLSVNNMHLHILESQLGEEKRAQILPIEFQVMSRGVNLST